MTGVVTSPVPVVGPDGAAAGHAGTAPEPHTEHHAPTEVIDATGTAGTARDDTSAIDRDTGIRRTTVAASGLALFVCTGGPSTYVALHLLPETRSWQAWTYAFPFGAVAVCGAFGLRRALSGRPVRTWPWPLWGVAAYVGWAMASSVWSVSKGATPQLTLTGAGIAAFACWFGLALHVREQIWAVAIAMHAAVVASGIVMLFWPDNGYMHDRDIVPTATWQGIFGNSNALAPVCVVALLALVGVVATRFTWLRLVVAIPFLALDVLVLVRTESATAYLSLLLVAAFVLTIPLAELARRVRVPGWVMATVAVVATVAIGVWVFADLDHLATLGGGDGTFTGRRPIWADVREFIADRPIIGHGFWAFWDRGDLTQATYASLGTTYGSAHNSLLEVMLGLGVVGVVLYLFVAFSAIAGTFARAWRVASIGTWWWATLLVLLLVQNLTESFVLWHSSNWVLFVAAALTPFGARHVRSVATGARYTLPTAGSTSVDLGSSSPFAEPRAPVRTG